jgi:hypothetical protein
MLTPISEPSRENFLTMIGIDISPTACRVMARRLRDVCTCRKANRSGAPDAASSSALDL